MKRSASKLKTHSAVNRTRRRRIFMKNAKARLQSRREVFFIQESAQFTYLGKSVQSNFCFSK